MKKSTKCFLTATTIILTTTVAQARDQIRIVGSSTVYPFTTVVAEKFDPNIRVAKKIRDDASRYSNTNSRRSRIKR